MMKGLITAIRTLTIVPVPGTDADDLAKALPWFPVVGGAIGAIVALAAWGMTVIFRWPYGVALACVALSVILTGGLHVDGLADVFDSFGGRTKERKLEIMKDPRIGTYGALALVLVVLAKCGAITCILAAREYWLLVVPFVISRTAQVALAVWLPYAKTEEGTGKRFVEGAKPVHFLVSLVPAAILCFVTGNYGGLMWLVASLAVTGVLMVWMWHAFRGVTGDLLGMASETIETFVLVSFAVAILGQP